MEADPKVQAMPQSDGGKRSVERSTIEFPYLDQENSFQIAEGVHAIGGSGCDWDQLAAHFKQAAQGGGFRLRLITAKTFGLVTYDRGRVTLTNLGLRSVDQSQQRVAKAESFLTVPLYRAVYDKFRGGTLPPPAGLERAMVELGVAKKQADKARQAFTRSAKFAGFFEFGSDRLVAPSGTVSSQPSNGVARPDTVDPATPLNGGGGGGGGGIDLDLDPLLIALLQKIPTSGEKWPKEKRLRWFKTFAMNVSQVYDDEDDPIELNVTDTTPTGSKPA